MKIISIAGTSSNIGKTTIAEFLIRNLKNSSGHKNESLNKNTSALKVTTRHQGKCIKGTSCGVCDSIKYPYVIIDDEAIINQEHKDTARLKLAGANKVIWLLSYPETLNAGIEKVLSHFDEDSIVVVEGNSFLSEHEADISLLVTKHSQSNFKKSAKYIIDKIDILVVNNDQNIPSDQTRAREANLLNDINFKDKTIEINPYSDSTDILFAMDIFKKFLA